MNIKNTTVKVLLTALLALSFSACSDSKADIKADMKELKAECEKEAMILKANKDKEGFKELMEDCESENKELKEKLKEATE